MVHKDDTIKKLQEEVVTLRNNTADNAEICHLLSLPCHNKNHHEKHQESHWMTIFSRTFNIKSTLPLFLPMPKRDPLAVSCRAAAAANMQPETAAIRQANDEFKLAGLLKSLGSRSHQLLTGDTGKINILIFC